jgi:autophagy-related protein 5
MSEIAKRIWDGKIAVVVTLARADSNQMEIQRDYYVVMHRNSYLPLYLNRILAYFRQHLLVSDWSQRPEWWFEFEEVPLKWSLPVGLLFDTLTGLDPGARRRETVWNLTLHYRNYPSEYILPLASAGTLEQHWMNQVKESCYVQNGTAKPIMSLSKQLSSDLWKSVETHNFNLFWSIFPKIIPKELKHIPVRFHLTLSNTVIDVPVRPTVTTTGELVQLGAVLKQVLPDLFNNKTSKITAKPVIHGINIPLETPLVELYKEVLYIDGFLHCSILMLA